MKRACRLADEGMVVVREEKARGAYTTTRKQPRVSSRPSQIPDSATAIHTLGLEFASISSSHPATLPCPQHGMQSRRTPAPGCPSLCYIRACWSALAEAGYRCLVLELYLPQTENMHLGKCRRPRSANARITSALDPRPATSQRSPSPTHHSHRLPRLDTHRPSSPPSSPAVGTRPAAAPYVCNDANLALSARGLSQQSVPQKPRERPRNDRGPMHMAHAERG